MTSYRRRRLGHASLLILALLVVAATFAAFFGVFGYIGFAVAVLAMLAFIALCQPRTSAGRRKVLLWLVGPGAVVGLALNWFVLAVALGADNCFPCVSHGDVHAARGAFFVAAAVWIIALGVYLALRGLRKGSSAGRR